VAEVVSAFEAKVSAGLAAASLDGFFATADAIAAAHGGASGEPSS
jgi:hypothetical protein